MGHRERHYPVYSFPGDQHQPPGSDVLGAAVVDVAAAVLGADAGGPVGTVGVGAVVDAVVGVAVESDAGDVSGVVLGAVVVGSAGVVAAAAFVGVVGDVDDVGNVVAAESVVDVVVVVGAAAAGWGLVHSVSPQAGYLPLIHAASLLEPHHHQHQRPEAD